MEVRWAGWLIRMSEWVYRPERLPDELGGMRSAVD